MDETFALQDLNTTYGTYINDCRIGNAYVRLYPGDIIRFGKSNAAYELVTQGEVSVSQLSRATCFAAPKSKQFLLPIQTCCVWKC